MLPTATFADITQADLLFVPGGYGQIAATADDETRAWVAHIGATAKCG